MNHAKIVQAVREIKNLADRKKVREVRHSKPQLPELRKMIDKLLADLQKPPIWKIWGRWGR